MDKTFEDLAWSRVVAAVRSRCVGPGASQPSLPIAATAEGMRIAVAETAEALSLLEAGEPLPLAGLRELGPHLERLERRGALAGPALRDIASTLGTADAVRRFLSTRRERAPRLHDACLVDPTLVDLADDIRAAVEDDGTIADGASAELGRLRTEVANLRDRLVARLEQMIVKKADLLSDRFYTIREGRYVLPVRTDAHERVAGIVHATSASGATVFVEPSSMIARGNRLKMAQAELEREEARILVALSDLARERVAEMRAAAMALDHLDLRAACARFGHDLGASGLSIADEPAIDLRRARHPELLLDPDQHPTVVPNDIAVSAGHGVVLSGPNAGGKTVALKLLGLAALMTRAGVPFPADEGSSCGFFDLVLTDVGDEQSIEKNLSTFSAHVTNLASILKRADRGSLVLLDELAGGTDPEEGAALACAVVDALLRRGAALAVTTHYEPLKALALRDERLRNASVGFDVERLCPTFELVMDVPGASSALAVARRFGIPDAVVDVAEKVLPEQSRTFDDLVRRLEDQRQALTIERDRAESEARHLVETREALQAELAAARERDRTRVGKEVERLLGAIRRAREDVKAARKTLKHKKLDDSVVRHARRRVEDAARTANEIHAEVAPIDPSTADAVPVSPEEVAVGRRVWVPRLRRAADVVEVLDRGRVKVAAGPMKLTVEISDLRAAPDDETARSPAPPPRPAPRARRPLPPRSSDNTVDVRGLRVDDAVSLAETFVDRRFGVDEPVVYVVHGIGTGALRDAIRTRLGEATHYVAAVRPGSPDEGGDGVTVIVLR